MTYTYNCWRSVLTWIKWCTSFQTEHFHPYIISTVFQYYTPRRQKPKADLYTPHHCSPKCAEKIYCSLSRLKSYSPLSKPLLCGFYRLLYKIKTKKVVIYKGPCGRMLRNMFEVHSYLRILELDLTVDLFDFNVFVRCLAEYIVDPKSIIISDLSKGKDFVCYATI